MDIHTPISLLYIHSERAYTPNFQGPSYGYSQSEKIPVGVFCYVPLCTQTDRHRKICIHDLPSSVQKQMQQLEILLVSSQKINKARKDLLVLVHAHIPSYLYPFHPFRVIV